MGEDGPHFSPYAHLVFVLRVICAQLRRLLLRILAVGPVPKHVAIIMDGNRRYADRSRMERSSGHLFGYDRLIETLENCLDLGVKYVTVYGFSIDNFARPQEEVDSLMKLMEEKLNDLVKNDKLLKDFGVRVQVLGDLTLLPHNVQAAAEKAMVATKENTSVVLNLCVAYTSTAEIVHSIQEMKDESITSIQEMKDESITEKEIEKHLYTVGCPPPDILIRTSGETRLSNFMLWQCCSYSRLVFCSVLWPEFSLRHLVWIILDYQRAFPALQNQRQLLEQSSDLGRSGIIHRADLFEAHRNMMISSQF